jgi:hypothetical protein
MITAHLGFGLECRVSERTRGFISLRMALIEIEKHDLEGLRFPTL